MSKTKITVAMLQKFCELRNAHPSDSLSETARDAETAGFSLYTDMPPIDILYDVEDNQVGWIWHFEDLGQCLVDVDYQMHLVSDTNDPRLRKQPVQQKHELN